jgi:hypothetical protein
MAADRNDNSCFAKSFQGAGADGAAVWLKQPRRSPLKYLRDFGSACETIEIIRCFNSGGHSPERPAQRPGFAAATGHPEYAPGIERAQR